MKKLTLEILKERLKKINPYIQILSKEYINSHFKLTCKCLIDGHIWRSAWGNLMIGHGCPQCKKTKLSESKSIPLEEIKERLKGINPNISVLGEFVKETGNAQKKIKRFMRCRCLKDDYIWDIALGNLFLGKGCPKCNGKIKLTIEGVKERIKAINPNIEILSDSYKNSTTKLKCKCLVCGSEFESKWGSLQQNHGCPTCGLEKISGENSYKWNPNRTQEDREIRRLYPEYREFVKHTMERDNYTCAITGVRGGYLEVHHLDGYHWYAEGRTDINNAVTLCEEEHRLFHSTYGCSNNTKEQFEEYKQTRLKQLNNKQ